MSYLYVELVNQRYDGDGKALGPFSKADWRGLLAALKEACENHGHDTTADNATSFDTGVGPLSDCPRSVVRLLECDDEYLEPLLYLRDEVEKLGGICRVLKCEDAKRTKGTVAL